jgi:hypothetical protein
MNADRIKKIFGRPKAPAAKAGSPSWREEIAKDNLKREEFCRLYVAAILELCPGATLESLEPLDHFVVRVRNEPQTLYFDNLWRNYRSDPEGMVAAIERSARIFSSPPGKPGDLPDKSSIVPLIKDNGYLDVARNKETGAVPFAHEHFVGDLWIVYAVDTPDAMKTLPIKDMKEMGLDPLQIKQLASENLRRIVPPIKRHGDGPVYMLAAGGDYEASLLLFDDVWEQMKELVTGDIVAAVPSRDVLLFTDSASKEGLEQMRASITEVLNSAGYLVSGTMLRRTGEKWSVFS